VKRFNLILILLVGLLHSLLAQVDTTVVLDEYIIQAKRIRQATIGSQTESYNYEDVSGFVEGDIPALLSYESGIYIKGYGLGSLATSSIRGGSAGHTLVLWNGIPLQSPLLGLLDLSLLSNASFEEIKINKGGQSAIWGSGAIGGVVSLQNKEHQHDSAINLGASFAAFGQQNYKGTIRFKAGNLSSQTSLNIDSGKNDFSYLLSDGLTQRIQSNAELSKQDIQQDIYYSINPQNRISLHYWYQNTNRQIPPTTVQTSSLAYQEDKANRFIAKWQRATERNSFQVNLGLIHEELNYFDPTISLESPSDFTNIIIDTDYQWKTTIGSFAIGASQMFTEARATGYQDDVEENKSTGFASYLGQFKKVAWQTSLRQEWVNGGRVPFIPSVGLQYHASNSVKLAAKVSRNYRIPTLNDRFWNPGGNGKLRPESGWSQELSLEYQDDNDDNQMSYSITGYSRKIDDWILWALLEEQTFISANNIARVWSRGFELRSSYKQNLSKGFFAFKAGYDFTKSTNEIALDQPALEKGEQLIYTPLHQAFLQAQLKWEQLHLSYYHQIVGAATGINENIKAFNVGNIRLQTNIRIDKEDTGRMEVNVFAIVHNLFNKNYRVIERRPTPGRYFSTGINIGLQK